MPSAADFWSVLAPHHAAIENSYFNLPSLRRIAHDVQPPVLVVGAGQGLIVAELRTRGVHCDGVDLNAEMIRYARSRRGVDLIRADARALPFRDDAYRTVIIATGVVDFMTDETAILASLREAQRVTHASGRTFVAFYQMSPASADFMDRLGLLSHHVLRHRDALELHGLEPGQAIAWIAARAHVGTLRAALMSVRAWAFSSWQEKRNVFRLQRIFARDRGGVLIAAAHEEQPYRNRAEIEALFGRLAIPLEQLDDFGSCQVARI